MDQYLYPVKFIESEVIPDALRVHLLYRWCTILPLPALPLGLAIFRWFHNRLHGVFPSNPARLLTLREADARLRCRISDADDGVLSRQSWCRDTRVLDTKH